jgi:hypothetical protein
MPAPKLALLLGATVAVLASAGVAAAQFTRTASVAMSASTATLAAPTGLSAAQVNCVKNQAPQISLSWTASSSTFTTGYTIMRATTTGGPYTTLGSTASGTTTYTDTSGTSPSTTYYYVVDATYLSWTARSNESSVRTLNNACK